MGRRRARALAERVIGATPFARPSRGSRPGGRGREEEERGYFEEALAIQKRLAAAEPDNTGHARGLSVSLDRLGDLALRAGRTEEARGYLKEALAIAERLAATEPESAE